MDICSHFITHYDLMTEISKESYLYLRLLALLALAFLSLPPLALFPLGPLLFGLFVPVAPETTCLLSQEESSTL